MRGSWNTKWKKIVCQRKRNLPHEIACRYMIFFVVSTRNPRTDYNSLLIHPYSKQANEIRVTRCSYPPGRKQPGRRPLPWIYSKSVHALITFSIYCTFNTCHRTFCLFSSAKTTVGVWSRSPNRRRPLGHRDQFPDKYIALSQLPISYHISYLSQTQSVTK